jgi:peptidyl-prolyl cis-trans isomerase C
MKIFQAASFFGLYSLFLMLSIGSSFNVQLFGKHRVSTQSAVLRMGLFDFFGPKKSASASHILMKGDNGLQQLLALKKKLSVSKNLSDDFAAAAAEFSSCPSSKNGGALGTFKQGQMVPAFDKVVFNEAVGVVHGPVNTPFGAHLILIDSRSD